MSTPNLPQPVSTIFFQLKRHRWQALGVIALGLMMVSPNLQAEEEFDADWALFEGALVSQTTNPESRIALIAKLSPSSKFLGPATEPPNPFPKSESALYVSGKTPADGWFRLVGRPFGESSAAQGVLEFEFRLEEGAISFVLGHCDQPWDPGNLTTYYITDSLIGVSFAVDQEVNIRGQSYQTGSVYTLEAGVNYRFMIKWALDSPEGYAYFLNGEPLTQVSGSPTQRPVGAVSEPEVNAFRIVAAGTDRLGTFFLGRISARSMPVDLYSPDGLFEE